MRKPYWGRDMKEVQKVLACMRANPNRRAIPFEYIPYKNSVVVTCDVCGERVFLGPEQQKVKTADARVPIWCLECSMSRNPLACLQVLSDKQMGE
jgi:hypothetical protein